MISTINQLESARVPNVEKHGKELGSNQDPLAALTAAQLLIWPHWKDLEYVFSAEYFNSVSICSTAGWVQMTIKPWHCPPMTKEWEGH